MELSLGSGVGICGAGKGGRVHFCPMGWFVRMTEEKIYFGFVGAC